MKVNKYNSCDIDTRYTKPTDAELVAIFPEAKQITKSLIKELSGEQKRLEK